MANESDMIRKIRAALAIADDASTTAEEKANAKAYAERLMAKYEIDETLVFVQNRDAGGDVSKDIVVGSFFIKDKNETFIPLQRLVLACIIAENMNCRAVIETKQASADVETGAPLPGGEYVTIVGFRKDVQNAHNLYMLLVPDIAMAVAREKQTSTNYVKQFAEGYVIRVNERLKEMRTSVLHATKDEVVENVSMALVLIDKANLVKSKFEEMFPPEQMGQYKAKRDSTHDPNAQERGRRAADQADLGGSNRLDSGSRRAIG